MDTGKHILLFRSSFNFLLVAIATGCLLVKFFLSSMISHAIIRGVFHNSSECRILSPSPNMCGTPLECHQQLCGLTKEYNLAAFQYQERHNCNNPFDLVDGVFYLSGIGLAVLSLILSVGTEIICRIRNQSFIQGEICFIIFSGISCGIITFAMAADFINNNMSVQVYVLLALQLCVIIILAVPICTKVYAPSSDYNNIQTSSDT